MNVRSLFIVIALCSMATTTAAQQRTSDSTKGAKSFAKSKPQSARVIKRKFQKAYRKEFKRKFPLASISVSEDCSAETTCPNGTTLECSIQGPSTSCHSDAGGVGCFKEHSDGSVTGSSGSC